MKHHTTTDNSNQAQARSLLADIQGAADQALPRRGAIVEWLDAFLVRAGVKGYQLQETEAADLASLDLYLRSEHVPVSRQASGEPSLVAV